MDIEIYVKSLSNLWIQSNNGILTYEGIDKIDVSENEMILWLNNHSVTLYLIQIEKYHIRN